MFEKTYSVPPLKGTILALLLAVHFGCRVLQSLDMGFSILRTSRLLVIFLLSALGITACEPALLSGDSETPGFFGTTSASAPAELGVTQWQQVDAAMELGKLRLAAGTSSAEVTVVRLDPNAYQIDILYDVDNAGTVGEWFEALDPLLVVNGGYFDQRGRATALVIFDGVKRGESYQGFGGMISTDVEGRFELRSLQQQPYDPNEQLRQAMQSAPMLIQPGGEVAQFEEDGRRSWRTVVARDTSGRILLLVSNAPAFTLSELAQALKNSDLGLDAALNLDGGRSTGLYLHTDAADVRINSLDRIPLVLAVQRQE